MTEHREIAPYDLGAMAGRPPTKEAPPFGRKVAELRKQRGLTQIEFAKQLGVAQQTVVHYERGTTNPSLELINRLAEFFDVSPAELVDEEQVPVPRRRRSGPKSQLDLAVERARKLSSKKQQVVARLINAYVQSEGGEARR